MNLRPPRPKRGTLPSCATSRSLWNDAPKPLTKRYSIVLLGRVLHPDKDIKLSRFVPQLGSYATTPPSFLILNQKSGVLATSRSLWNDAPKPLTKRYSIVLLGRVLHPDKDIKLSRFVPQLGSYATTPPSFLILNQKSGVLATSRSLWNDAPKPLAKRYLIVLLSRVLHPDIKLSRVTFALKFILGQIFL